eukprot:495748-Amphidinium_carterae.1
MGALIARWGDTVSALVAGALVGGSALAVDNVLAWHLLAVCRADYCSLSAFPRSCQDHTQNGSPKVTSPASQMPAPACLVKRAAMGTTMESGGIQRLQMRRW